MTNNYSLQSDQNKMSDVWNKVKKTSNDLIDSAKKSGSDIAEYFKERPILFWGIIITVVIIMIVFFVERKKENFEMETENGILSQKTTFSKKEGPIETTTYGDTVIKEQVESEGLDLKELVTGVVSKHSTKQAENNLKAEMYMGMQESVAEEDDNRNFMESDEMGLLKNQAHNIMIEKSNNIGHSNVMNALYVIQQETSLKQIPLEDVNELEEMNRDAQAQRDHQSLVEAALGSGLEIAPTDPNQFIKERVKYVKNSGRPSGVAFLEETAPIHEEMEFTEELDLKKEADILSSGDNIELPKLQSIEKHMNTTQVTQEPVVETDEQKVILSEDTIQSPQGPVIVEKTVNPEVVSKVEQYTKLPESLVTKTQKDAAGQYMTTLILMKYSGIQIPELKEIINKFPELYKMKAPGLFNGFPKDVIIWAEDERQKVIRGEKSIDTIIAEFKALYNVDPIQETVTGKLREDGSIEKETVSLTPISIPTQQQKEKFSGLKRKFIVKKERYVIYPGNGIKNRSTEKYEYIV